MKNDMLFDPVREASGRFSGRISKRGGLTLDLLHAHSDPPLKSARSDGNFRQLQVHPPMTDMFCPVGAQSMTRRNARLLDNASFQTTCALKFAGIRGATSQLACKLQRRK